jgi:hypothetical protein
LLLLLLLLSGGVRAVAAAHLRMFSSHLGIVRGHLRMMRHLLIHRMLPVSRTAGSGHFAGMDFCLVSLKVWFVPVIFGSYLVPVFSDIASAVGMMFSGRVSTFVFIFSRSGCPCGSNALRAFAVLVALIK